MNARSLKSPNFKHAWTHVDRLPGDVAALSDIVDVEYIRLVPAGPEKMHCVASPSFGQLSMRDLLLQIS